MECLHCVLDKLVWIWIVFVVESQTPWGLVLFVFETHSGVELDSDWDTPFEGLLIELKPHLLVAVYLVLWSILIKHVLHFIQDVEQVVLSWCHYLENTHVSSTKIHKIDMLEDA